MDIFIYRIASVIIIAAVYMLFDVFNKRNVPSIFAYATLAYGFILTLFYPTEGLILESIAISLIVLGLGYVVYRVGQIGAADIIEFAAISLMLPLQPAPFLQGMPSQFGLPMIISILVSAGIVSLVLVPLYYLPRAKRILKRPLLSYVDRYTLFKSVLITCTYLVFIAFMLAVLKIQLIGAAILLIMLVFSTLLIMFEKPITDSMVEYVDYTKFDEGDIIAFNLMTTKDIQAVKRKVRGFNRLITANIIRAMKAKRVKTKLPVYKNAVPLALPIFIGIVISLTIGNLIFFIIP
jgi:Flp pilus assembly protein protease CpaA